MSRLLFNDNEPYVAQWLRNLYPEAVIDGRSVIDLAGADLNSFQRVHLFAGIGGWEYALELAGWPEDVSVWTGSCPCQPFSTAGKRKGVADARHLWPEFRRLIAECRPPVIFGEQVASKDGRLWLSGVRADLEALGYGVGAADLCAAGVGAPHIRQRLYWVAYSPDFQRGQWRRGQGAAVQGHGTLRTGQYSQPGDEGQLQRGFGGLRGTRGVAYSGRFGSELWRGAGDFSGSAEGAQGGAQDGWGTEWQWSRDATSDSGTASGLGNPECPGSVKGWPAGESLEGNGAASARAPVELRRPGNPWDSYDLLYCRDDRYRRVGPGTFPLAPRVPSTVGRIRAYGNSIVPPLAAEFIGAFMEAVGL